MVQDLQQHQALFYKWDRHLTGWCWDKASRILLELWHRWLHRSGRYHWKRVFETKRHHFRLVRERDELWLFSHMSPLTEPLVTYYRNRRASTSWAGIPGAIENHTAGLWHIVALQESVEFLQHLDCHDPFFCDTLSLMRRLVWQAHCRTRQRFQGEPTSQLTNHSRPSFPERDADELPDMENCQNAAHMLLEEVDRHDCLLLQWC